MLLIRNKRYQFGKRLYFCMDMLWIKTCRFRIIYAAVKYSQETVGYVRPRRTSQSTAKNHRDIACFCKVFAATAEFVFLRRPTGD